MEPALKGGLAGAIHWTDPWTVRDPGALVTQYFKLFERLGGTFVAGAADGLEQDGTAGARRWTASAMRASRQ